MGICASGEEEAAASAIPPPTADQKLSVQCKRQGMMDKDYNVLDKTNGDAKWMLIDAVGGGMFSGGCKYILKHRKEGEETSDVLGTASIVNADSEFKYKVTDFDHEVEMTDSDGEGDWSASEDGGWAVEINLKEKAKWKFEKECRLFAPGSWGPDLDQPTEQIGKIVVKCKGKYKKKVEITQIHTTDEEGNDVERENREEEITLKVKSFHYKMKLQGVKYELKLKKTGGHFSWNNLKWEIETEEGEKCCEVIGDGRNCSVETTGAGGDATAMLLGSFAVACKFDPEEIEGYAKNNCNQKCSI